MSKPEPRFSVGERVMIRSKYSPEYNCDDTKITNRVYGNIRHVETGFYIEGWAYETDSPSRATYWNERALRPRPKPATESFDELMSAVKQIGKQANV